MTNKQLATFGGGCFWCIEAIVQRLEGIEKVVSGYAGGKYANPSYREVCGGRSGHAEVIKVTFDPKVITYEELIGIFMTSHDPTTLNQQGADRGTQYRSVIFYHDLEQKEIAEKVMTIVGSQHKNPITTELSPLPAFYAAEDYHQDYYNNNGSAGYCRVVIDPKIRKLRDQYAGKLKEKV